MYKTYWEVKIALCFIAVVVCCVIALSLVKQNNAVVVSTNAQQVSLSSNQAACEGLACLFPSLK
jgi:hypothetical protein